MIKSLTGITLALLGLTACVGGDDSPSADTTQPTVASVDVTGTWRSAIVWDKCPHLTASLDETVISFGDGFLSAADHQGRWTVDPLACEQYEEPPGRDYFDAGAYTNPIDSSEIPGFLSDLFGGDLPREAVHYDDIRLTQSAITARVTVPYLDVSEAATVTFTRTSEPVADPEPEPQPEPVAFVGLNLNQPTTAVGASSLFEVGDPLPVEFAVTPDNVATTYRVTIRRQDEVDGYTTRDYLPRGLDNVQSYALRIADAPAEPGVIYTVQVLALDAQGFKIAETDQGHYVYKVGTTQNTGVQPGDTISGS